ncbi:PH domain-containing protein [Plantactinospora sp. S1510]|uniref:PH domain-containing protein n=1 Tax=Plantactinospora alkalitolerans TaxID=2789879 RepID=A0ABS0GQY9_9ACTN|nr:PH domain-containing protein [Plantactinospora alkalitolerans]MBF9128608.1 PH domain-containing protein [Plantactinospora alkalitolerans]
MLTFRSRSLELGYQLTAAVLTLLGGAAVVSGIRTWRDSRSASIWAPEFTLEDAALTAGFAALFSTLAVLCWRASRRRLRVDDTGITWTGIIRRRHLGWSQIAHVDLLMGVRNGQVRVYADRQRYVVFRTVGPFFGTWFSERRLTTVLSRPPDTAAPAIHEVHEALLAGRDRSRVGG